MDLNLSGLMEFHKNHGKGVTRVLASTSQELDRFQKDHSCGSHDSHDDVPVPTGIIVAESGSQSRGKTCDFLYEGDWAQIKDAQRLWAANMAAVNGLFPGLHTDPERTAGTAAWVGHHCKIHPSVELNGVIFVGNYSIVGRDVQLMGGAVIGEGCIIGDKAAVRSSLILDQTYLGENTEISDSIASGNLVNVLRIGQWVVIPDAFILSGVDDKRGAALVRGFWERTVAAGLLLCTVPLWLPRSILRLSKGRSTFDNKALVTCTTFEDPECPFQTTETSLREFVDAGPLVGRLPGLIDVLTGRLGLVGVRPIERSQVSEFNEYWTRLRFQSPPGLFTPVDAYAREDASAEEMIVIENEYAATRSFLTDISVLVRAVARLALRK
jgi:mannose-1-phosphate guanylyltransferase / phosphomannomutase